jgi:hypothetical protein
MNEAKKTLLLLYQNLLGRNICVMRSMTMSE